MHVTHAYALPCDYKLHTRVQADRPLPMTFFFFFLLGSWGLTHPLLRAHTGAPGREEVPVNCGLAQPGRGEGAGSGPRAGGPAAVPRLALPTYSPTWTSLEPPG